MNQTIEDVRQFLINEIAATLPDEAMAAGFDEGYTSGYMAALELVLGTLA